jgi:carotenoid cleavage dioxygenase
VKALVSPGARQAETEYLECRVEGEIPDDLEGALFRLGGSWYYPPKFADDIPLHADGFISMFRVKHGRVGFSGRFVETERLRANRETGRMRFGYYRNRGTDDPDVAAIKASAANTTAFAFGGKLFALKEDGLPYEIDPTSLATVGTSDLGGLISGETFTAHPKIDGRTGELVTFGYQALGPFTRDVFFYVIGPDGEFKNEIRIALPWLDMIHDIAITAEHILIPLGGYAVDRDRLAEGGPLWRWDPAGPARIGVLRRDGDGSDLRWFTGAKRCLLHTFNAFQDGEKIVLDAPFYEGNPFPFLASLDNSAWSPDQGKAFVRRLTFDLGGSSEEWVEEILFETVIGDLGAVDPRVIGHEHRYCFGGHEIAAQGDEAVDFARPPWPIANSYVRFDLRERAQSFLKLPAATSLAECEFVPKPGSQREGEGYILGVADDLVSGRSMLVVADAERLEAGPLARAHLPFGAGPQVHGCWVPEGAMPLRDLP